MPNNNQKPLDKPSTNQEIREVTIIAARSKNHVIGRGDEIPWRVKGEQKLFKELTMGGCMIMGRKTFESIGRPLPGRDTIIVTRNAAFSHEGCECVNDIPTALKLAQTKGVPIHFVGGGEIYRQAFDLNIADVLHITTIQTEVEGDVYFPQIPENDFSIVDEKRYLSNIDYLYVRYERVSD